LRTANLSECDSALRTNLRSCVVGTQIENFAFTVSRSPQPKLLLASANGHFVEMPLRGRSIASAVKFSSKDGPNVKRILAPSLKRHPPTRGYQILDLGKPSVKHDVPGIAGETNGGQKRSLSFAIFAAELNNGAVRVTKPVALRAQLTCYRSPHSSSTLQIPHGRH
jgi:hypothetical protein